MPGRKEDKNMKTQAMQDMCEEIVEGMKDSYHSDVEPWEAHKETLRLQLLRNMEAFHKRFSRGGALVSGERGVPPQSNMIKP